MSSSPSTALPSLAASADGHHNDAASHKELSTSPKSESIDSNAQVDEYPTGLKFALILVALTSLVFLAVSSSDSSLLQALVSDEYVLRTTGPRPDNHRYSSTRSDE